MDCCLILDLNPYARGFVYPYWYILLCLLEWLHHFLLVLENIALLGVVWLVVVQTPLRVHFEVFCQLGVLWYFVENRGKKYV